MITLDEYVGTYAENPDWTSERQAAAIHLLAKVNPLREAARAAGVYLPINPATNSEISGKTNGGFRPHNCPEGSPYSSHKEGRGVDCFDPHNDLDQWLTDEILEQFGLYREHPDSTPHWVHLTDRSPPSGHRTFQP